MKKCIITVNLLYYITFFHLFNGAESQSASSSTGQPTPETAAVDSGSTNPPVTTTVTPITLNINISKDTDQFYYKKDGNFRTYTPKDGNVFRKVVKKSNEIWTAKPEDHGLKAVLMGSGRNEKHLALLLQSGKYVLLHKSGKNKPWNDLTSTKYDISKLRLLDDSDAPLTSSDYTVDLVDLSYTLKFKDVVKCKKVTYNDNELWNHTDDPEFGYLKGLYLGLPSNKFFVMNSSDVTKELIKAKVSVDVTATQSGDTDQSRLRSSGGTPKSEGTEQSRSRSSGGTPKSEGTEQSRSSGGTPKSEGTDQSRTGTQQTRTGEKSDYEKLLDQNLQGMTW